MKPEKILWFLMTIYGVYLLSWVWRFYGHVPAYMDSFEYAFPEKWVNVAQWRSGVVPLWNPLIGCGAPHLAQSQPSPFYPPHLLWNLTGLFDWFYWMALAHTGWAWAGFFFWSRYRGHDPIPSFLTALSFSGCAMMTQFWGFPTHLATVAWVPWIFLALDRALERDRWDRWLLFGGTLALQWLSGYAFTCFYTILFLAAYAWAVRKPRAVQWAKGVAWALGAAAVSSLQWLPFLDYLGYAHRETWARTPFCFTPWEYLTLLKPDILGVPGTTSFKGVYGNYIYNMYFGLIPLVFFLVGVFTPKWRSRFFSGAAVFALVVASGFRFLPSVLQPQAWVNTLEPAKVTPLFVFCALTAALDAMGEIRFKRVMVPALVAVLWLVDLGTVPYRLVQLVPDPYRRASTIQQADRIAQAAGAGRIVTLREAGNYYPGGEGSFEESQTLSVGWMIPNTNVVWGVRSVNAYLSSTVDGFQNIPRYLSHGIGNERLLDAAGARLLILPRPPPFPKYMARQSIPGAVLVRNAGALPDGWKTDYVREFPDRKAVFTALMDSGAFLERDCYTEKGRDGKAVRLPPPMRLLTGNAGPEFGWIRRWTSVWDRWWTGKSHITPERVSPCRQMFEADFTESGFLAFNETFAPGWRAWVDGAPKTIFRAYGLFMAVPVQGSGLHRVVFRYEPVSFRLGLFVSLLACVLAVSLSVLRMIRKKDNPSPSRDDPSH